MAEASRHRTTRQVEASGPEPAALLAAWRVHRNQMRRSSLGSRLIALHLRVAALGGTLLTVVPTG